MREEQLDIKCKGRLLKCYKRNHVCYNWRDDRNIFSSISLTKRGEINFGYFTYNDIDDLKIIIDKIEEICEVLKQEGRFEK